MVLGAALLCAAPAWLTGIRSARGASPGAPAAAARPQKDPLQRSAVAPGSAAGQPQPPASQTRPGDSELTEQAMREEAFGVARGLMQDFPGDTEAMGLMGTLYMWLHENAEAEKWWQKCLEQNPRDVNAYHGLAMVASKREEHQKALELWRKAQEIKPDLPGLNGALGEALLLMGDVQQAAITLEKEVRLSPGNGKYSFLLGQAYFRQKEYQKAARCYQKAMEILPLASQPCYGLASVYARLGETEKARQYMDRFRALRDKEEQNTAELRQGGSRQDAVLLLAQTHAEAGDFYATHLRLKDAEAHWQRAASLDPRNRPCRRALADLYRVSGRLAEALQVCEQLRDIDPGNAAHYCVNMGMLLVRLQRLDAAEDAFRKALELAPTRPPAYRSLAQLLLMRNQKLPEAKTLAQRLVELEPTAPNYSILAEACHRNGDQAGAREALRRAMDLDRTPRRPEDSKAPAER
jgi:tetratricopeptide (TPR) repeat protein